jgi:hypothetical protein
VPAIGVISAQSAEAGRKEVTIPFLQDTTGVIPEIDDFLAALIRPWSHLSNRTGGDQKAPSLRSGGSDGNARHPVDQATE